MDLCRTLIIATALFSFSSSAELIKSDWKTPGDNLAYQDVATGITFLDISVTMGMSINQVNDALGSTFIGWRMATAEEASISITSMYENSGLELPRFGKTDYEGFYNPYFDVVGARSYDDDEYITYNFKGVFLTADGTVYITGAHTLLYDDGSAMTRILNARDDSLIIDLDDEHERRGIFLVRDYFSDIDFQDVTAPFAFFSLALFPMVILRRRAK